MRLSLVREVFDKSDSQISFNPPSYPILFLYFNNKKKTSIKYLNKIKYKIKLKYYSEIERSERSV